MAKYSYEFKLQVVQAYLDGEGGPYLLRAALHQYSPIPEFIFTIIY